MSFPITNNVIRVLEQSKIENQYYLNLCLSILSLDNLPNYIRRQIYFIQQNLVTLEGQIDLLTSSLNESKENKLQDLTVFLNRPPKKEK